MTLLSQSRPYRAAINEDGAADKTIVAAVALKHIVVVNLVVALESGQTIIWKSGATALTALSGAIPDSYTAGDSHAGLFETAEGEELMTTISSAGDVDGHLTYVLLP